MVPRATYRLQFHAGFTFGDAEAIIPYLDRLGISHVYASPITTAVQGSMHGYDVVDPTRINPELGGEEGFRRLVAALRRRGMGIIIDIVPNHMGVAGSANPWWNDVLRAGPGSAFAPVFDIDWNEKIVLPLLGDPLGKALSRQDIQIEQADGRFVLTLYGDRHVPLRDEEQGVLHDRRPADPAALTALLERQHYRLVSWRVANDSLNWRRFFTVNDLAGVRIEDPAVFDLTHQLYFRLFAEGLIDGVRVDHVDGLADPAGYCRTLRHRLDEIADAQTPFLAPAYVVVEKILGAGETLATDWGVDGTSGYDFMEEVSALLHDPAGAEPLEALWQEWSGRSPAFEPEELLARQEMLDWQFAGQLDRCVDAFVLLIARDPAKADVTASMVRRAIERLLWIFPVYRTYSTGSAAPITDESVRKLVRERVQRFVPPGEGHVLDLILAWLAGKGPGEADLKAEAVRRFQQLSSPIAAKAVEDTAFYRYGRLLSRTDVGFDPRRFSQTPAAFHRTILAASRDFPHRMLTTATHDHKRGEDSRARLAVLSELPEEWQRRTRRWRDLLGSALEGIDPGDAYILFQSMFGAWPQDLAADNAEGLHDFAGRLKAWQQKALREAKLRSSWEAPDEGYEARVAGLIDRLLDPARSGAFLGDFADFVSLCSAPALANTLVQVALRTLLPGVPDLYQGAELADLSFVDPDNRRPVDYALRAERLARGDDPKLALLSAALTLRRQHPDIFAQNDYSPADVDGARAGHIFAFSCSRGSTRMMCAVMLRCGAFLAGRDHAIMPGDWWGDTTVGFPQARVAASDLFARGPVYFEIAE